jgi:uncharacterized protein YbjT (DUF2867 family)
MSKVLILGGSGFIGSALAEALVKRGDFVTVPTRDRERAKHLLLLPTCEVITADVRDRAALEALVARHDVVINLVGILSGDFDAVHVAFPRAVAEACTATANKQGNKRLIHMSALNADANSPSAYLRSRGLGEAAVWQVAQSTGLAVTMFRPSVVFGEGDNFLNMLARLIRTFPVIPLGSPNAQFQVVWVEDVARAIDCAFDKPETEGQVYALVGPKVYTLRQLVEFVMDVLGMPRPILPLPDALARIQALCFEFPPGKWLGALLGVAMTRDNVLSMQIPSVSTTPFPAIFGHAAAMEAVVGDYLKRRSGRAQYAQFRQRGDAKQR